MIQALRREGAESQRKIKILKKELFLVTSNPSSVSLRLSVFAAVRSKPPNALHHEL